MRLRTLLLPGVLCLIGLSARATPIMYTETVTATGSLNSVAFTNALLTLYATADTSNVTGSSLYSVTSQSAGGSVAGVGSFTLPNLVVFSNQQFSVGGFSSGVLGDILDVRSSFFNSYDLRSQTAVVSGSSDSSRQSYPTTSGGNLSITSIGSTATFQAQFFTPTSVSATPEPGSLALLGTGVLGLLGAARRRFA